MGIARGSGAVGRSTGDGNTRVDSAFFGVGVFSGLGVFSGAGDAFFLFRFPVGVGLFFAVDFFFTLAVALGVELAFSSIRRSAFGVRGSAFSLVAGDWFSASGVSVGFAFDFGFGLGFGVGLAFLLADFFALRFGVGLGDSSESDETARVFRNCSRLRFSSSLTCARRTVPRIALSAITVTSQRRKRTTAAQRNRASSAIKQPASLEQLRASPPHARAGVRAAGWRLIYRQAAATNTSDTSR